MKSLISLAGAEAEDESERTTVVDGATEYAPTEMEVMNFPLPQCNLQLNYLCCSQI
jgi:hypothetical protein